MVLDHLVALAHADHGEAWAQFVSDWWRSWMPPLRRPTRQWPPVSPADRLLTATVAPSAKCKSPEKVECS